MIYGDYPTFFDTLFSSSTDCQPPADAQANRYSHFHIRAAQVEDLNTLAEILADSFHFQNGVFGWAYPFLRLGIYEDLRTRLRSNSPDRICLVALERATKTGGDKLVGTVEMALRSTEPFARPRSRYPYLSNLAVRSSDRRRGVAKQLLLNCERVALEWRFQDLYLHVLENNHHARQLYFNLGYRLHKVDSSWNGWLLGKPRQLFLHKQLHNSSTNSL